MMMMIPVFLCKSQKRWEICNNSIMKLSASGMQESGNFKLLMIQNISLCRSHVYVSGICFTMTM